MTPSQDQPIPVSPETTTQPTQPKPVAIVGFASSSRDQAPFTDPNWSIWTMNHAPITWIPRWDVNFELHTLDHLKRIAAHSTTPGVYMEWLEKQPGPGQPDYKIIYTQEQFPSIPASVPVPRAELNKWFAERGGNVQGFFADDYFTSTISFMLAMAIMQGCREIGLFGIDLLQDEEYCIGPETKVLTADLRWVQAGSLKEGDQLVGFDEETQPGLSYRRWRTATVEAVQRLRRPSRRIHTSDGKTIMCSAEHRWLTRCGGESRWRTTDELVFPGHPKWSGNRSRLYRLCDTWDEDRSWDAGYLAAAFDGEGNLCQTSHRECRAFNAKVGFAQRENGMAREVRAAIKRLGFSLHASNSRNGAKGDCAKYELQGGRTEMLRFLGSIRPRRLLDLFSVDALGSVKVNGEADVLLVEDIGEQEVVGLRTSTKTFVAEGFATHNSYQRAGAEYLVGFARGMGIKVYVPEQSALCKANYVYGWSEPAVAGEKALAPLVDYIDDKAKTCEKLTTKAQQDAATINGAIQMIDIAAKWVAEGGADGKDALTCLAEKRADLDRRFGAAQQNSLTMTGQSEAFKTCVVWAKHWARGGALKS